MIDRIRQTERCFTMEQLYADLNISRQAVHQSRLKENTQVEIGQMLLNSIKDVRRFHPCMGSRPLYHTIKQKGIEIPMGINRFETFVRENNLTVKIAKSKYPKTSDGLGKDRYENLTNGLKINNINQLISADITYFDIEECRTYLFILKDVYSQTILSINPSRNLYADNAVGCLQDMVKMRRKSMFKNCIHHSDNGSQYNSVIYKKHLNEMHIRISRSYSCDQNGSIEQMNHVVKNMYLSKWCIDTFKELNEACEELVYLNNNFRPIKQLGYLPPVKFEKKLESLDESQRPIFTMHDFENGY